MLPARAENIAVVRHVLGAFADVGVLDDHTVSDVRIAASEACANVVVHAYPVDEGGPLLFEAGLEDGRLALTVRDDGPGIAPDGESAGLGLALIAALAETVRVGRDERDRNEVRMTFALPAAGPDHPAGATA